jgi:Glycosyltransferase family 87
MFNGWRLRLLWLIFGGTASASSVLALRRPEFDRLADLHVYYGAVRLAQAGRPLYEYAADNGDPFNYPPFAALVLWPIGWLSESVARVMWVVAVCAAVAATAVMVAGRWDRWATSLCTPSWPELASMNSNVPWCGQSWWRASAAWPCCALAPSLGKGNGRTPPYWSAAPPSPHHRCRGPTTRYGPCWPGCCSSPAAGRPAKPPECSCSSR